MAQDDRRTCTLGRAQFRLEVGAVGGMQSQFGDGRIVTHVRRRYRRAVTQQSTALADSLAIDGDRLPIKMLNDRVLVHLGTGEGERRSTGGILIPATAQMGKRLVWAEVVAVGPNVRAMETGDQVLFNPEDRYEVEVQGKDYIILRERDVHAVAAERLAEGSTGLYL